MGARENECHPRYSLMFKLNFYGSFAFLSKGHSIFIQTPPLRMTGFQMGGGSDFFSRKPTIFWPFGQIFQRCRHTKNEPFEFHFPKGRDKNLKLQFLVILRGVGGGGGGCPVWVPTGYIPHSYLTLYNPVTKLDQLVWSLLEKDYCIHNDFMISYEKWHQIHSTKDAMTSYMYTT